MAEQVVHSVEATSVADLLERILDKGLVIVGDIRISVTDVELLAIKIRLLVASVERAKELGIDWWASDAMFSSKAKELETENRALKERLERLERKVTRSKKGA
jgi:hypothetical protein